MRSTSTTATLLSRPWPWLGLGVVFSVVLGMTWVLPVRGRPTLLVDPKVQMTLEELQQRVREAFSHVPDEELVDASLDPTFLPGVERLQRRVLQTRNLGELRELARDIDALGEERTLTWLCAKRSLVTDHIVALVVEEGKSRTPVELEAMLRSIILR
jgi:hypothetical protein